MTIDYAATAEAADPYCLRPGEASALLAGHPWHRFVVIGDSVAQGIGDPVEGYRELPWADRIAAELAEQQPGFAYLNLGERELFAAAIRERQLDPALRFKPDLALISAGGNDALKSSYQPDVTDLEVGAIISALRAAGADVITVGLFNVSYADGIPPKLKRLVNSRMRLLSEHTAALAEKLGAIHVPISGHPAERDATIYSADGVHGNLRSHAICAAESIRRLGAHLGRTFRVPEMFTRQT